MALQVQPVGRCYRKIKSKICGGNVIEYRLPRKRFDKIIGHRQRKIVDLFIGSGHPLPKMIIGPGEFAGYICTKCGMQYSAPPLDPELVNQVARKLAKILTRPDKR